MVTYTGFFSLRTPRDLLAKMKYDYQRLSERPTDAYAAFDFFVTAYHMKDWVRKAATAEEKKLIRETLDGSVLFDLCQRIANGAKHFTETDPTGKEVRETVERPPAVYGRAVYGLSRYNDAGGLEVRLTGKAARELGASVDALHLASYVLEFWREYLEPVA